MLQKYIFFCKETFYSGIYCGLCVSHRLYEVVDDIPYLRAFAVVVVDYYAEDNLFVAGVGYDACKRTDARHTASLCLNFDFAVGTALVAFQSSAFASHRHSGNETFAIFAFADVL